MNNHLHIVCLDAPAPPDYGGAIDMYYKIKALSAIGIKITLHYFQYNDRDIEEIKPLCENIFFYKRSSWIKSFIKRLPYIVSSRINKELISRLNKDNEPVLLEGIHCTGIIPFLNKDRKILIRVHNNEAAYYDRLAKTERNFLKKLYFQSERYFLLNYQKQLPKQGIYLFLSEADLAFFKNDYGIKNSFFIPCFIPWKLEIHEGKGKYCLYHGNMGISENEEAALWLIQQVFSQLEVPFIIAGKNISKRVQNSAQPFDHISLIDTPAMEEMDELIREVHINLTPSFNSTGVKLKMLHALLHGRFCIANKAGIEGSNITHGIIITEAPGEYIQQIKSLIQQDFKQEDILERNYIGQLYNNEENAKKISAFL